MKKDQEKTKMTDGPAEPRQGFWSRLTRSKRLNAPTPDIASDDVMFPAEFAGGGRSPSGAQLIQLLDSAARDMIVRRDALHRERNALINKVVARGDAQVTRAAQVTRILIGLVWLAIGGWLFTGAYSSPDSLPAGMPRAHAAAISEMFFFIGAAALVLGGIAYAMIEFSGRAHNKTVRKEADHLGRFVAREALQFDETLRDLRDRMNRRQRPADAVDDLSRAHLAALEAQFYLQQMPFLTNDTMGAASDEFRKFLAPQIDNPHPVIPFVGGAITGVWLFIVSMMPVPELPDIPIAQYPWALNFAVMGAFVYAIAGVLLEILLAGVLRGGAARNARSEALDAMRSGYAALEAPRLQDIVRGINDAVDVFRARVGGDRLGGNDANLTDDEIARQSPAYAALSRSTQNDGAALGDPNAPAWRRPDSGAKFVDTEFLAAPKTWRVDAFSKKSDAAPGPGPGSKRGAPTGKNTRRR